MVGRTSKDAPPLRRIYDAGGFGEGHLPTQPKKRGSGFHSPYIFYLSHVPDQGQGLPKKR